MARDAPSIDAYGDGGFRLSGDWRAGSLLILEDAAHDWPVVSPAEVTAETRSRRCWRPAARRWSSC